MKQLLDVEDVAGARVGARLHHKADKVRHVLVGEHRLDDFYGRVDQALFAQEEEAEAECENPRETMFQVFLFLLEKDLCDALSGILVA